MPKEEQKRAQRINIRTILLLLLFFQLQLFGVEQYGSTIPFLGLQTIDNTQKGYNAFYNGQYIEAVKWFKRGAKQGDAQAQRFLAVMYDSGYGVIEDEKNAVKWFKLSAQQGDAGAQYTLGLKYFHGSGGLKQNKIKAYEWWRKSAKKGNKKAQMSLDLLCKEDPRACRS